MAYDEGLVDRLRLVVAGRAGISETKMFGGVSFSFSGNLAFCATNDGDLMVRVGRDGVDRLLDEPGVVKVQMGARTMRGWVRVALPAVEADADLRGWVDRGLNHARSLPAR